MTLAVETVSPDRSLYWPEPVRGNSFQKSSLRLSGSFHLLNAPPAPPPYAPSGPLCPHSEEITIGTPRPLPKPSGMLCVTRLHVSNNSQMLLEKPGPAQQASSVSVPLHPARWLILLLDVQLLI